MESVLISIIVPVYNVETYLKDCIEHVLMQDYVHWELLLVDDGSTDNSGRICDDFSFKDKRIYTFHKSNGGLSSARNFGLDKAKGKYVIFLDSDDYWLTSDCLRKLVNAAVSLDADVVRGEYKEVNECGDDLHIKDISHKLDKANQILSSADFFKSIVNGENFSVLFLFARRIFDEYFRFDEKRRFEEDVELNIRLFCKDLKCVYIPEVFYAYRKRSNSIVHTFKMAHLQDSFLLSDVFEKYSHIASDPILKQVYRENAVMMYYWTLVTIAEDPYYAQRKKIINTLALSQRRKRILRWANKYKIIRKSYIANVLHPNLAVLLFRLRNKLSL